MNAPKLQRAAVLLALLAWALPAGPAPGLTIQFDYTYDTGFFTNPAVYPQADAARAALQYAAASFEMYTDHLAEIRSADPRNTWQRTFSRPDTGQGVTVDGGVVPADTIIIYVGADDLGGSTLGWGGPGGWGIQYTSTAWLNTVRYRGQAGAALTTPTDVGPWGGNITFNSAETWSFDLHQAPPDSDTNDFVSTAIHELCHVLGIGTATSWNVNVVGSTDKFKGPAAVAAYGGQAPLDGDHSHWAEGTLSTVAGVAQEAVMDPDLTTGTGKRLTVLDRAALGDVGWQMPAAGDADHDGDVDAADYLALKASFGSYGTWADGDFDGDGVVGRGDLLATEAHFGLPAPGPAALGLPESPVPEPASLAAVAAGAVCLLRKRPRGAAR